jgi:hypothetical protein
MRARVAAANVIALLLAAGCKPSLQDGAYSCVQEHECPSGWSCHEDGRCHRAPGPEDAAGGADGGQREGSGGKHSGTPAHTSDSDAGAREDAGNAPDASAGTSGGASGKGGGGAATGGGGSAGDDAGGANPLGFRACTDAASCDGDAICAFGPDSNAQHGVCSHSCDRNADCAGDGTHPAVCANHECLPGCDGAGTCTDPAGCYLYTPGPMQPGVLACFELKDASIVKGVRCEPMMAPCSSTLEACLFNPQVDMMNGVCGLHCDKNKTDCPKGGACLQIFENRTDAVHCLQRCASTGECNPPLMCGQFGGEKVCVPQTWIGMTLLPEPPTPPSM